VSAASQREIPSSGGRGRRLARILAALYLIALVLVPVAFRLVGERSWIITMAMYLPRLGFLLPMPFVAGALVATGDRLRGLAVAVVATLVGIFPLMGYQISGRAEQAEHSLRLMSWNTYHGRIDNEAIRRKVDEEKPDIFLAQAFGHRTKELFRADPGGYVTAADDEFFIATRYPIVDKYVPPPFADDSNHKPSYVRYTLETPLGLVDVFNIHPRSPRTGVERLRGLGLRTRLMQGDIPDDAAQPIAENTALRRRQVEAVVEAMRSAKHPILVAGDTNLPTLSWLFANAFSQLRDGFSEAGSGFGYTFPAKRPWLRIDRVLADASFRFLRFQVGSIIASDHHYVIAELARP
jgi:vancomycin resistance protein VanJ